MFLYFEKELSWKELARRTVKDSIQDDVAGLAAQLSYYFFLSLFPALLFLVALASFFPLYSFTDELMRMIAPIAPAAVVGLLKDQLTSLSNSDDTGLLSIGLLMALWSSSAAMVSVIDAMNRAYDIEDSRAWCEAADRRDRAYRRTGALHPDLVRADRRRSLARGLSGTAVRPRARVHDGLENSPVAGGIPPRVDRFRARVLLRARRRAGVGVDYARRTHGDNPVVPRVARVPLLRREFRQLRRSVRNARRHHPDAVVVLHQRPRDRHRRRAQRRDPSRLAVGKESRTEDHGAAEAPGSRGIAGVVEALGSGPATSPA